MNTATKTNAMNASITRVSADLKALKSNSITVNTDLNTSRNRLHSHLSAAYLWWRDAKEVKNYLDGEYKKINHSFRIVNYDPNFIPLIWLVWGDVADLTNQHADRYSRALREVHKEFEEHFEKYAKDSEAKLAHFIKQSGGITKLAGYATNIEDFTGINGQGKSQGRSVIGKLAANDVLLKNAYSHADSASFEKVYVAANISSNDKDYSLLLVKKTGQGSTLKATSNDTSLIEIVLAEYYRCQFDAAETVIRPLLELIQTQCYPKHLKHLRKKLIEKNKVDEKSGKKLKSVSRVVYLHEEDQFMLSDLSSDSSVVSLVKLNAPIMLKESVQDVFMPLYQRATLEHNFLQGFNFNQYSASASGLTDEYGDGNSAACALTLEHRSSFKKNTFLHFWPFYSSFSQPMDQVKLDQNYSFTRLWEVHVPHSWFHELSKKYVKRWLDGHGTHLGRKEHIAHRVNLEESQIDFSFYFRNGGFECHESIGLGQKAKGTPITVMFRSQDWLLAAKSVALLPVDGSVSIAVNNDKMVISFSTRGNGGAEHEIHIPTVDEKYDRCATPFSTYEPNPVNDDKYTDTVPGGDDLAGIAASWPEAGRVGS